MQTYVFAEFNIPAEITDIRWNGLKLRINGSIIDLIFSSTAYTYKQWLKIDGFYLVFGNDEEVMMFLRAVSEDNRKLLVLSKLISVMWHQYSLPAVRRLLRRYDKHGETDAARFLRSVYLSLTHKRLYNAKEHYMKIRELLPEAWNLFEDEDARRYIAKLMDFETNLIAYGIKG